LPPLTYTLTYLNHWQLSAKNTYNILIKTNTNVYYIHRPIIKNYHVFYDFTTSLFPWGLNYVIFSTLTGLFENINPENCKDLL
jgi:hypothetical protein